MARENEMPEVDFKDIDKNKKLRQAYIYAKQLEERNVFRALIGARNLKWSRIIGITCGLFAAGVYSLTINRVQQETFLEDWEEPEIPGRS